MADRNRPVSVEEMCLALEELAYAAPHIRGRGMSNGALPADVWGEYISRVQRTAREGLGRR
jgi:hypothetical protein